MNETMEASIGINIRGPSRTAYVSKKDEDDKKKAGQSYTVLCESFGSAVSTLKDGCGRQSEKEEEEEEEDHSKTVHVLAPEKLLLIELKALFAEFYPPLSPTCKVRIYTTKSKWPQAVRESLHRFLSC
jgi:hypothetical protein